MAEVRVLLTTTPGAGHFGPLAPFAHALRRAGDEVLVAARAEAAAMLAAAGLPHRVLPGAAPDARAAVFAEVDRSDHDAANARVTRDVFAGLDARAALPGVVRAIEAFRPDVVLSEAVEVAGPLAAERAGVPAARVDIVLRSTTDRFGRALAAGVEELRAALGLAADPGGAWLGALPAFSLTPPVLEDPGTDGHPGVRRFREVEDPAAGGLPDAWPGDERPLVSLTFGSVAAGAGFFPGLYRAAVDALAELDARVLLTVGHGHDLAALGPLPPHVHAEAWVPQAAVLPHAAAVVCHGGFGTVRAALAAGVPLVVLPLFADQPYNARRVAELGAGVALPGGAAAAGDLLAAVRRVLAEPSFRAAAGRVAADARALPPVDAAPDALRALAA